MKLSLKNLNKPSNVQIKKLADFFLYTLPLYQVAILTLPMSDSAKMWIGFIISMLVVTLKGMSKFTVEETIMEKKIMEELENENKEI